MHLMCSPLESKEKAHADNCGFIACSPTCGHFPTLLLFPDNGKPGGHINSPAELVPTRPCGKLRINEYSASGRTKKAGILDSGLVDHGMVAGVRFELTTFGLFDLTQLSLRVGLYLHPA